MQKIYKVLLVIFIPALLFPLKITAQDEGLLVKENLHWLPSKEIVKGHTILCFEGAVNHDNFGFLPVYQYILPAGLAVQESGAQLANEIYEPAGELDPENYPDLELIGDEPGIITSSFQTKQGIQHCISILPLRKANGQEGYERLISFELVIQTREAATTPVTMTREGSSFGDHSVLRSGDWYRLAVSETGIYKITYDDLAGMGIDPDQADPRNIRLFGNGNGMVDEANSGPRIDDLLENDIYVAGESDGKFDPQDFILFYGEGPVVVRHNPFYLQFEHEINFYTDSTYYFLNTGNTAGKRISEAGVYTVLPTHEVTTFQELAWHEEDKVNLIKSGKIWYGEVFNTQVDYTFPFYLNDIDISEPVYLKINLAGRSTTKTIFNVSVDGDFITELDIPSVLLGSQIYARPIVSNYEMIYTDDENMNLDVSFVKPGTIDIAWMNYIEVNYIRHLRFDGGQLSFRDTRPVGPDNIARYHIQTNVPGVNVWAVSDPENISTQLVSQESGGIYFQYPANSLQEFIAFDGTAFFTPTFVEKVENQDLHSLQPVNYVIVVYPLFLEQANRLADFHRQYSGMSVCVVTPQQIYNEFSSGAQDVSAIRDFMKMLYDRTESGDDLRYLLLFGDASFDYKDIYLEDNNLVPTYEAREALKIAASFVTDDFFGCFDYDEGSNAAGTLDIGIGRFPVNSLEQAEAMVSKTIDYMSPIRAKFGPWRNSICYIGDDEDNNTHLGQAEGLVEITDSLGKVFNVNKIYLDAYQQLKTPSGYRYPDVNAAIDRNVTNGCLIMNYTGHGGEIAWADERVLDIPAIQSYRNIDNLPAFVTATCEFSRYDDPGLVSAGELVFLNPNGAGIGLFTTTRLAFSQSNYALNKRFNNDAFIIDSITGEYPRMGDLLRVSKTPSNQNIKNFVLLGDPALMLSYPKMRVRTLDIINEANGKAADTLHALSRVTITGQVEDLHGNLLEGFNGLVYPSVYDKPVRYQTRGNDPASKIVDFYIQDKKIYEGIATVTGGKFSFTFVIPLDISYQVDEGKISYYALDTIQLIDANGFDNVLIGGSDELAVADTEGPDIKLYLNTRSFVSGDLTTPEPMLIAMLTDSSGINTVGNGIGHDIVAIIDGNYQEPVVLNDFFIPETDSYQEGMVLFGLGPFASGTHTLSLKAWDVLNNSSEKTIEFIVDPGARLTLSQLFNNPNPYRDFTRFEFKHNKPGSRLDVSIMIFNLSGQLITVLHYELHPESTGSGPLYWNGRDASGNELSSGLYVYRLLVESDDGYFSSLSQKFFHSK